MRKIYLKSLLLAWVAIVPLALSATDVVLLQSNFDFGEKERADITSTMPCHFVNQGIDTVFIQYFPSMGFPFALYPSSNSIAPGDTLEGTVSFHRWVDEGSYSFILEISFADDTLSLNVSGSIVDNTPEFSPGEISYWVGTGSNRSIFVVDFNSGLESESVAFGYQFDGSASAQNMIIAIANAYPALTVNLGGGFLMDIIYGQQSGLGGNPEWWMTTTRTDSSLWQMNIGLSTTLIDGDWFGCTYSPVDENWNPINLPGNPVSAPAPSSIVDRKTTFIKVFPNPCSDFIFINLAGNKFSNIEIINMNGKLLVSEKIFGNEPVDVRFLPNGIYSVIIRNDREKYSGIFIKE
ncbi:MAG: T9SS type A sorting domain-containing protein [Bacteroidota bacterium]|nr:T9SS type A sorting domain-containing protein [Bacteroidota bacterium]